MALVLLWRLSARWRTLMTPRDPPRPQMFMIYAERGLAKRINSPQRIWVVPEVKPWREPNP
jgi:hypothetical protein